MIQRALTLLLMLFSLVAQAECIVTFNTYGPIYAPKVYDRSQKLVQEIKDNYYCDIIHFQEVWNDRQIDILEQGLGSFLQVYSPNRKSRIGLMLFSKRNWAEAETYSFRVNYDEDFLDDVRRWTSTVKAFSIVKNALPDTSTLNTHLHPSSERVRILQIFDILNWRVGSPEGKLILTGDFNADPNSFEHQLLESLLDVEDAFELVHGPYPPNFCTYCTDNDLGWLRDDHVFDFVFISRRHLGDVGWKPTQAYTALRGKPDQRLSDHYGIRVDLEKTSEPSSGQSSALLKQKLLQNLDEAELKVMQFKAAQDEGYLELIQTIRAEIISGQGLYGQYFSKIFQVR